MTRLRAAGRTTFRSLAVRNFRLFFAGQFIKQVGTWMQTVSVGLLVLSITGSGVAVGAVTAAQFGPVLLVGAWAGVLADRTDRHHLLLGLNAAGAAVAATFALVVVQGAPPLWAVYGLTTLAGTVTALESPARRAFVTDLVDDGAVANAVGLNSMLMTGARVVGPALGGALITGAGFAWCFALTAASYGPQLWLFSRMDRGRFRPAERADRGRGRLREGIRYAWATPELRYPLLLLAAVGTLAFNYQTVMPLFAERALGGGPGTYATLFSIMSAGSVVGALTVARRSGADAAFLARSSIGLAVTTAALALAPGTAAALVLAVPVGVTSVMVISGANAVVQLRAAPAMRGRVLALLGVVFLGTAPVGGPLLGAVAELAGARTAVGVGAVASMAAGILVLRALDRVRAPAPIRAVVPAGR